MNSEFFSGALIILKTAFYYHIPATLKPDGIYFPSYFGLFIDALANECSGLVLLVHESTSFESGSNDYRLKATNITLINLGLTTPAWHRALFHRNIMKMAKQALNTCDSMIVRCPCALAPFMHHYMSAQKIWFMAVGDYREAAKHWKTPTLRDKAIKVYLLINDYLFRKRLPYSNLLVNSKLLFDKYSKLAKKIDQISTTTLSSSDFYDRTDTCTQNETTLLYTGRIDRAKGLFELVEAVSILRNDGMPVRLNIAGWELKEGNETEKELRLFASTSGAANHIHFLGKLSSGKELNQAYREADIYVIPSYHEGFPRTIWEAFANSLPVITTAVGGIPDVLTHLKHAYLIPPRDTRAIVTAVKYVISNAASRKFLINEGKLLAEQNTLEIQTKKLVQCISIA